MRHFHFIDHLDFLSHVEQQTQIKTLLEGMIKPPQLPEQGSHFRFNFFHFQIHHNPGIVQRALGQPPDDEFEYVKVRKQAHSRECADRQLRVAQPYSGIGERHDDIGTMMASYLIASLNARRSPHGNFFPL